MNDDLTARSNIPTFDSEEILAGIKDQASMEAARDRLRAHFEAFEEITQRAAALPPPQQLSYSGSR